MNAKEYNDTLREIEKANETMKTTKNNGKYQQAKQRREQLKDELRKYHGIRKLKK